MLAACSSEVGLSLAEPGITDAYCDAYAGVTEYDAYFECFIEVIAAADCSTTEGITALSVAVEDCP